MKKRLTILIAFLVILSGCSTTPAHKVTILEDDGVSVKKEVSNPTEGYKVELSEYGNLFLWYLNKTLGQS